MLFSYKYLLTYNKDIYLYTYENMCWKCTELDGLLIYNKFISNLSITIHCINYIGYNNSFVNTFKMFGFDKDKLLTINLEPIR